MTWVSIKSGATLTPQSMYAVMSILILLVIFPCTVHVHIPIEMDSTKNNKKTASGPNFKVDVLVT
jgi:hypothetical protein